jgi:hypothetical protein
MTKTMTAILLSILVKIYNERTFDNSLQLRRFKFNVLHLKHNYFSFRFVDLFDRIKRFHCAS